MNKCPDRCSGGDSTRQHELTDGQFAKLSAAAQQKIEASSSKAYRCNYCGCVYLNGISGSRKLGDLNSGVMGEGWSPV